MKKLVILQHSVVRYLSLVCPSHGEQVLPSERGARYNDEGFEAFGPFDVRYNNGRMVSR